MARKSERPAAKSPDITADISRDISEAPLAHRAFPEVADALRPRAAQIIEEWMTLARRAIPSANALSHDDLRDNLPNILKGMADALGSDSSTNELKGESPAQGIIRFQQRYDVRDLMTEDRLLRKVIIIQTEAGLKRRMTQEEQIGLEIGIDLMMQEAVVAFVNHQNTQLRSAAEVELKYLSFLSHDLNNNLGTITLWLQVLRSQLATSAGFGEALRTLDTAQQTILDTIGGMGRLLQAERLRRQGVQPAAAPVNLQTLITNLVGPALQLAERKGVDVVAEVEPNIVVVSDGELITLVLQNLIGNAIKYSTRGTVTIRCRRNKDDERIVISVSDQGPGIPREDLEHIFAAFTRAHTYGQKGIGLGLTIASQATKLLDGELTVESEGGKGTTFSLFLPPKSSDLPQLN
jgi:signal transduction histidine kinase